MRTYCVHGGLPDPGPPGPPDTWSVASLLALQETTEAGSGRALWPVISTQSHCHHERRPCTLHPQGVRQSPTHSAPDTTAWPFLLGKRKQGGGRGRAGWPAAPDSAEGQRPLCGLPLGPAEATKTWGVSLSRAESAQWLPRRLWPLNPTFSVPWAWGEATGSHGPLPTRPGRRCCWRGWGGGGSDDFLLSNDIY